MKKILLVLSITFLFMSVANANQFADKSLLSVSKSDTEFLFDSSVNTISLNSKEMQNTKGEVWANVAGALVGGYVSGAGYIAGAQGNVTSSGLTTAFLGGAAAGFISPANSIRGVVAYAAGGYASGYNELDCCPF
ncbi:MAG: hypothetical protein U5K55_00360 [Aliarcobacter sp.]|nr:hypothetical protein [Aliarcobacter sp.]